MTSRAAAGVLAGLVLLVGLFVGFSSATVGSNVSCGSAFSSDTKAPKLADDQVQVGVAIDRSMTGIITTDVPDQSYVAQCASALSTRRTISLVSIGGGALVGLFCLLTMTSAAPRGETRSPVGHEPPAV